MPIKCFKFSLEVAFKHKHWLTYLNYSPRWLKHTAPDWFIYLSSQEAILQRLKCLSALPKFILKLPKLTQRCQPEGRWTMIMPESASTLWSNDRMAQSHYGQPFFSLISAFEKFSNVRGIKGEKVKKYLAREPDLSTTFLNQLELTETFLYSSPPEETILFKQASIPPESCIPSTTAKQNKKALNCLHRVFALRHVFYAHSYS